MERVKTVFDAASYGIVVGVLTEILPVIASALSIIWLGIQIYDWYRKNKDTKK